MVLMPTKVLVFAIRSQSNSKKQRMILHQQQQQQKQQQRLRRYIDDTSM